MSNNIHVEMTRRYPKIPRKVLKRDAKLAEQLIRAWDIENDRAKVLDVFLRHNSKLSDYRYWEMLRTVWILSGGLDNVETFKSLFRSMRKHRHFFSTPEEHKYLEQLPDQIKIYRACNSIEDQGISWTLENEYAEWYKERFDRKMVVNKVVNKTEVFAYINRNNEHEILILNYLSK